MIVCIFSSLMVIEIGYTAPIVATSPDPIILLLSVRQYRRVTDERSIR